jgi:hypothetical protein
MILALLPGTKAFSQCEPCQSYHIVVFNTDVQIAQPSDSATWPGWNYLKNHCSLRMRNAIRENELSPDCIHLREGGFTGSGEGTTSLNSQTTAPSGSLTGNSLAHYLIRSVATESGGAVTVSFFLETTKSREVVTSFTRSFRSLSDIGFQGTDVGKNAGFQGFSPLSMIIRSFETKKRDENKDVAIDADRIEVLPSAKAIEKEEEAVVVFRLTDCDGEALPGRKILLNGGSALGETLPPPTLGHFKESEVVTDDNGSAKATFVAGKQKGKAVLNVHHIYTAPFGEERYVSGQANITVKGDPVTLLSGKITITSDTRTGQPSLAKPENERSESHIVASAPLMFTIYTERIENIVNDKRVLNTALTETSAFVVADGLTKDAVSGEPTSIKSRETYKYFTRCPGTGELELSRSGRLEGQSTGFDINVDIALERGVDNGDMTFTALTPKYCVTVGAGSNTRQLFQSAKYPTSGADVGKRLDYPCGELQSFSEKLDPKTALPFGSITATARVNNTTDREYIVPLSVPDSQGLQEYLLSPEGVYTIVTSGSYRKTDNGELEEKVHITLSFWPADQEPGQ